MTPPTPRYTPPPPPLPVAIRRLFLFSSIFAFLVMASGLYETCPWFAFGAIAALALINLFVGAVWRWREAQRKVGTIFEEELG